MRISSRGDFLKLSQEIRKLLRQRMKPAPPTSKAAAAQVPGSETGKEAGEILVSTIVSPAPSAVVSMKSPAAVGAPDPDAANKLKLPLRLSRQTSAECRCTPRLRRRIKSGDAKVSFKFSHTTTCLSTDCEAFSVSASVPTWTIPMRAWGGISAAGMGQK